MAYQNTKQYGWCPPKEYRVHEVAAESSSALRKRFDRPRHHKGHVTFKTNNEEPKTVAESPSVPETKTTPNVAVGVDQRADMFIMQERRRMELARLKSLSARSA